MVKGLLTGCGQQEYSLVSVVLQYGAQNQGYGWESAMLFKGLEKFYDYRYSVARARRF